MINKNIIKTDIIKTITEKKVDRRDFLKYSGLVLITAIGLKPIVSLLTQPGAHKQIYLDSQKEANRGFGGGKYGV